MDGNPEFQPRCRIGASALGEPGLPAADVARAAVESLESVVTSNATVDRHLADQLLIFLAIAGGQISAPKRTDHLDTHLDLLDQFGATVQDSETMDGTVEVYADGEAPENWEAEFD